MTTEELKLAIMNLLFDKGDFEELKNHKDTVRLIEDIAEVAKQYAIKRSEWISCSERLPTENDADEFGKVLILRDVNLHERLTSKSIHDYSLVKHCDKATTKWTILPSLPTK